jgi:PhnB protein
MRAVNPYLNFPGNTEEAFTFYRSVFGGDFDGVVRFRDFGDDTAGMPEEHLDKIAHISLPIGTAAILMGTDVLGEQRDSFVVGTNTYIYLSEESAEAAHRLFDALSAGGRIEMPLQATGWAELYGSCVDKYGVQWMVDYAGSVQWTGGQQG